MAPRKTRRRSKLSAAQRKKFTRHKQFKSPPTPWEWSSGTTFSMLSQFLECREQTYLTYFEGWTSRRLKSGLEFGSIWHLCQEIYYKDTKVSPVVVANKVCSAYEKWRRKTLFTNEHNNFETLLGTAEAVFPACCDHWKSDDKEIDWLAPEQKFSVPYEFVDYNGKSRIINLNGMRDGLFSDEGGLGVFETKTKSIVDTSAIRDQLKSDMQTMIYLVTAGIEFEEQPQQVLYNVVRRPTLKRKVSESVDEFLYRVRKDVDSRPDHYFMRWGVQLQKNDIKTFREQTLDPLLCIFSQWVDGLKKTVDKGVSRWLSPFHFRNCNALVGKYGKVDLYDLIQRRKSNGYYQRKICFPELDESILDSKAK